MNTTNTNTHADGPAPEPTLDHARELAAALTIPERAALCHGVPLDPDAQRWSDTFIAPGPAQIGGSDGPGLGELRSADGPLGLRALDPLLADRTTALPCGLALASTWSPDDARDYARVLAREARAAGVHTLFGPGVGLMRTPLGGRVFEYLGEDPHLAGALAAEYVRALQSHNVAACPKHLVANDLDAHRHFLSAELDEVTLRELHYLPFELCIERADPWALMTSNSLLNGVHCAEHPSLVETIARGELGFSGVSITDWRGAYSAERAAAAGTDLTMGVCAHVYAGGALAEAVERGRLPVPTLDAMAARAALLRLRTGADGSPPPDADRTRRSLDDLRPAHRAAARRLAARGMALVKNADHTLPLRPDRPSRLVLTGPAATLVAAGGGSSLLRPAEEVTPAQGLAVALGPERLDLVPWLGAEPHAAAAADERTDAADLRRTFDLGSEPAGGTDALLDRARVADTVVFCALGDAAGEGRDLDSFDLPHGQAACLERLTRAHSRVVVCLFTGQPMCAERFADSAAAVLVCWFAGQESGSALADVLTGAAEPAGRLPVTWARSLDDYPPHALGVLPPRQVADFPHPPPRLPDQRTALKALEAPYTERLLLGSRWFDAQRIDPRWPLGHGLAYRRPRWLDARIEPAAVHADLHNSHDRPADEVVQVYVTSPAGPGDRPAVRSLRAFDRATLEPHERRQVRIALDRSCYRRWSADERRWVVEPGDYIVEVGRSSRDIVRRASVRITGAHA